MSRSLICITFVISLLAILSNAADFNETSELLAIRSQLADLQAEVHRQQVLHNNFCSNTGRTPWNCAEATAKSQSSGIYEIHIPGYIYQPFKVACDATTQGGGWTIILSRLDGSVDFYRNWNAYKKGFGDLDGEFFLGLDKIHALTAEVSQELLVVLEDFEGIEVFERYEKFAIGNEEEQYALHTLGAASGTADDSLSYNHPHKFTTYDRDNDENENNNCAQMMTGAWWYNNCSNVNLAGKYNGTNGVVSWAHFRGGVSLKRAIMMIRPRLTT